MKNTLRKYTAVALLLSASLSLLAQQSDPAGTEPEAEEEVIVLSPFEVTAETQGYYAGTTLAGNRLSTDVRDIGNAVTVITSQFLKDIGATDSKTLLQYTTNTEVGGFYGNFAGFGDGSHLDESGRFTNPNSNTRIRGLTAADNTREFFLTSVPWEGYNIDGVDLQRGPNSILFGQGSPAGIINTRLKQAGFKDSNEVTFRVGSWGSTRATLDINKVLIKNELAIRVAAVRNDEQYKQDPAFSEQKRIYGAVRYEPGFLKRGTARTVIKANVEFGDIDSNNPRQLPPTDRITPWFFTGTYDGNNIANQPFTYPQLNKLTVNPAQNEDDNTGRPNTGYDRTSHNGPSGLYIVNGVNYFIPKYANNPNFASGQFAGTPNEYFQPWIAGSMLGVFGSPAFNFQHDNDTQLTAINWEPSALHGRTPTGAIYTDSTGVGTRYMRPASVSTYSDYARKARLLYNGLPAWSFGLFKDKSLTDPTVFDFYNNLFDGPTKWEFQKFRNFNVSVAQTFFNDRAGFEASYNNEWYKSGKVQLLTNDSLNIDINRVHSDGTPTGLNGIPWEDGTPNPNLGKPYVGGDGQFGNNQSIHDRESGRITGFVDIDFNRNQKNAFTRFMGRHVMTGFIGQDRLEQRNQDFTRYSIDDPAYIAKLTAANATTLPTWTGFQPFTFIYLGDSLMSASTASGAHIPAPQVNPAIKSGSVLNFDTTWTPSTTAGNPNYVDFGAVWHDDYYPFPGQNTFTTDGNYRDANGNILTATTTTRAPGYGTQNQNPLNYVGIREYPINVIDSLESQANMDRNTRNYLTQRSKVFSRAFTWQGHFWDKAIVATWGVRKDIAKSWQRSVNTQGGDSTDYFRIAGPPVLPAEFDNKLEVTSHAWTAVAHLNQIGGLKRLPILVTLFYNNSTDFQPAAQRVDIYGEALSAPSGETKDMGVLLETKDGRFSLKVNKYETTTQNSSSSSLGGAWFIGSSQVWSGNWVNRFEFNWRNDTIAGAVNPADADYQTNTQFNYERAAGESAEQAKARELSVIAAWRSWQASVDPRFYAAWQLDLSRTNGLQSSVPNGFTVTEDSISEGYEIEFSASPTRNWRLSLNASKTEAQRTNIGGQNLQEFMAAYTQFLGTGAPGTGGDLRIWWGGAGNETALQQWNTNINSEWNQRKLQEGTNVPELREWRLNAITNYDFDSGPLKNFNIGGGVRYEDTIVIGYEPIPGDATSAISFDIANPYRGPSDTNYDAWIGYRRKIWRNIDWSVQLNVRNIGVGNELVPVTTQPDGSGATYRIRPPQTWQLTNTFRF
jgi:outer membrane receptor protein involved in Fe transport